MTKLNITLEGKTYEVEVEVEKEADIFQNVSPSAQNQVIPDSSVFRFLTENRNNQIFWGPP